jgi:hypothetical protein
MNSTSSSASRKMRLRPKQGIWRSFSVDPGNALGGVAYSRAQPVERAGETLRIDGFEEIVGGVLLESLQGVFVVGGDKDDLRQRRGVDHADHFETAEARHLDVEENHVGAEAMDRRQPLDGVGAFAQDLDVGGSSQQRLEFLARGRFVIDDQCGQHGASSSSMGKRMATRVQQSGSQLTSMP